MASSYEGVFPQPLSHSACCGVPVGSVFTLCTSDLALRSTYSVHTQQIKIDSTNSADFDEDLLPEIPDLNSYTGSRV